MGASSLLCDIDSLSPEVSVYPPFTLDDCSPFFVPPARTKLCDAFATYDSSFRPDETELYEHFFTAAQQRKARRRKKKRERELKRQLLNEQEEEEDERDDEEEVEEGDEELN